MLTNTGDFFKELQKKFPYDPTYKQNELLNELREGKPSIWLQGNEKTNEIAVVPVNIQDGEEELVGKALKEIFQKYGKVRS